MTNATAVSFGYPDTKVGETASWLILLRPKQATFGSLVLICKEPATAFSQISPVAFEDLKTATSQIEGVLRALVDYRKINYLMLMMVDPDVHFHVIPRYDGVRTHQGVAFADAGWPGPPDLSSAVDLGAAGTSRLAAHIARLWPQAPVNA